MLVGTEILKSSAVGHTRAKLHLTWLFTVKVPVDGVALLPVIGDLGGGAMVAAVSGCPRLTL